MAYSQTLAATGGTAALHLVGLRRRSAAGPHAESRRGSLSGTPTQAGSYTFTVAVNGAGASQQFTLIVNPPALSITTTSLCPTEQLAWRIRRRSLATGGTGAYTWSVSVGPLPLGLTLSPAGVLSGTPTPGRLLHLYGHCQWDSASQAVHPHRDSAATLAITTPSPLPNGTVGVAYSQATRGYGRDRLLHLVGSPRACPLG